jgi:2-succinyl-6-hydroxy-2,4-cyclohexadiene-1-carboxylate synthase
MSEGSVLHVEALGPAGAPALMFLHGFLGCGEDWRETASAFSDRYRCLLVDLPGHGQSIRLPDPAHYSLGGCLNALDAIWRRQVFASGVVVGYSMGGRMALSLACRRPTAVSRLVLVSASPGIADEALREARRLRDQELAIQLETQELEAFLRPWYQQPLFMSLSRNAPLFDAILARRRRNTREELAQALRHLGVGRQPPCWEPLAGLTMPILAVAGEWDAAYQSIAREMSDVNPGVQARVVARAGHLPHLENPADFHRLLASFLERADGSAR